MGNSDVVVVNEWTRKNADGSGSRGATPGDYLTRYMAREDAVEFIAPARVDDVSTYMTRYMARENAVDEAAVGPKRRRGYSDNAASGAPADDTISIASQGAVQSHAQLAAALAAQMKFAGVAFGNDDVSLSHEDFLQRSADVQAMFDGGKTVMKTVVSFDQEYLHEMRVVSDDFQFTRPGDYRGNIDQLKLRSAIMAGCERVSSNFDNLQYVGVIQVDTAHVHCHLVMVDAGEGRKMKDGSQSGIIPVPQLRRFKRAVDASLQRQADRTPIAASASYEQRSLNMSMRKWAYDVMLREADAQFLFSVLPENRDLWRPGNDDPSMARADAVVREIARHRFADPDSGYARVVATIERYADDRAQREGLSDDDREAIVDSALHRVEDAAVSAVYQVLRAVPEEMIVPAPEYMALMGADVKELESFGFGVRSGIDADGGTEGETRDSDMHRVQMRMRSYTARKRHHEDQAAHYREREDTWLKAYKAGKATEASRAIGEFYATEAQYHEMAAAKYTYFMPPAVAFDELEDEWEDISQLGYKLTGMRALRADASIMRMSDPDAAEALGEELYGFPGGRQICAGGGDPQTGRRIIDDRIARMQREYSRRVHKFRARVADMGARVEVDREACMARALGEAQPEQSYELEPDVDAQLDAGAEELTQQSVDAEASQSQQDEMYDDEIDLGAIDIESMDTTDMVSLQMQALADMSLAQAQLHADEPQAAASYYETHVQEYAEMVAFGGESVDEDALFDVPGVPFRASVAPDYEFEACRMVDMHDMGRDWLLDTKVGEDVARDYAQLAVRRRERLRAAKQWLSDTGQVAQIAQQTGMAEADILRMEATAREVGATGVLAGALTRAQWEREGAPEFAEVADRKTGREASGRAPRASKAYPLDAEVMEHVDEAIDMAVADAVRRQLEQDADGFQPGVGSDDFGA